jgi:hypothetical protein
VIILDGVTYDLVVQRDGADWLVADRDGAVLCRRETRRAAERALAGFEDRLIGQGGRRAGLKTQETQETNRGTR